MALLLKVLLYADLSLVFIFDLEYNSNICTLCSKNNETENQLQQEEEKTTDSNDDNSEQSVIPRYLELHIVYLINLVLVPCGLSFVWRLKLHFQGGVMV